MSNFGPFGFCCCLRLSSTILKPVTYTSNACSRVHFQHSRIHNALESWISALVGLPIKRIYAAVSRFNSSCRDGSLSHVSKHSQMVLFLAIFISEIEFGNCLSEVMVAKSVKLGAATANQSGVLDEWHSDWQWTVHMATQRCETFSEHEICSNRVRRSFWDFWGLSCRILTLQPEDLQQHFEDEAHDGAKNPSRYARNLLEYACFKALSVTTQVSDHMRDKEFPRLVFDMMLAWETPGAAHKPSVKVRVLATSVRYQLEPQQWGLLRAEMLIIMSSQTKNMPLSYSDRSWHFFWHFWVYDHCIIVTLFLPGSWHHESVYRSVTSRTRELKFLYSVDWQVLWWNVNSDALFGSIGIRFLALSIAHVLSGAQKLRGLQCRIWWRAVVRTILGI